MFMLTRYPPPEPHLGSADVRLVDVAVPGHDPEVGAHAPVPGGGGGALVPA